MWPNGLRIRPYWKKQSMEWLTFYFLYEICFVRFNVAKDIVTAQGTQFNSMLIHSITRKFRIKHEMSNPYDPQANEEMEFTKKILESILIKTIQHHHRDWVKKLLKALWAYRIICKNSTKFRLYELVYGKQFILRI